MLTRQLQTIVLHFQPECLNHVSQYFRSGALPPENREAEDGRGDREMFFRSLDRVVNKKHKVLI